MTPNPRSPIQKFFDAVRKRGCEVTEKGKGQYQGQCPAHEDKRASLSVSVGDDGRVLIKCHAGCTSESVVGAVGLKMADLFEQDQDRLPSRGKPDDRVVATYDYTDEDGKLLYQVVRMSDKKFWQRRPDGNGAWIWGLNEGKYRKRKNGDWTRLRDGEEFDPAIEGEPAGIPSRASGRATDTKIPLKARGSASCLTTMTLGALTLRASFAPYITSRRK